LVAIVFTRLIASLAEIFAQVRIEPFVPKERPCATSLTEKEEKHCPGN
jgi:hypothetical protein